MYIRFGKAVERGKKHFPKLLNVIPVSKMDEVEGVGSMAYSVSVQSFISLWLTSVHSPMERSSTVSNRVLHTVLPWKQSGREKKRKQRILEQRSFIEELSHSVSNTHILCMFITDSKVSY